MAVCIMDNNNAWFICFTQTDEEHSMNRRSADYLRGSDKYKPNYGGKSHLSSNYMTEETFVDANSEKEQVYIFIFLA